MPHVPSTTSDDEGDELAPSAMHEAASAGDAPAIRALLAGKAPPDVSSPGDGDRPLLLAARGGHAEVVELLLAAGMLPGWAATRAATDPVGAAAALRRWAGAASL